MWILLAVVLGAGGIGLVTFLNRPEPVEWVSGVDEGPEPVQDGAAPTGVLTVNGASGGQLFVDGSLIGEIPVAGLRLPPGEHLVAVERPGYDPFVRTITVAAGDTVVVDSVEAEMPPVEPPPN